MICYKRCEIPVVMKKDLHISGTKYVDMHEYDSGHKVPIYLATLYYVTNILLDIKLFHNLH